MPGQIGVFVAACFYYSASGGHLRRHLLYLRRHYRMPHLEEALEELYAPSLDGEDRCDRRTPLVLMSDDGCAQAIHTHARHSTSVAERGAFPSSAPFLKSNRSE